MTSLVSRCTVTSHWSGGVLSADEDKPLVALPEAVQQQQHRHDDGRAHQSHGKHVHHHRLLAQALVGVPEMSSDTSEREIKSRARQPSADRNNGTQKLASSGDFVRVLETL